MNGTTPPNTPGSSSINGTPRKPATLKKRRPTSPLAQVDGSSHHGGHGGQGGGGPGPSPLRKEMADRELKESDETALERRRPSMLKRLIRYEVPRKTLHTSIGFVALYLYCTHQDVYLLVRGLSTALAIVSTADMLRFASRRFERFYEGVLGFLMRESEKTTWNGVIWYLVGVVFVLSVLPRDIATLSVMLLSWADTSASVFGRKYGKYTPSLPSPPFASRKSVAGTLGAFFFGGFSAWLFFNYAAPIGSENDQSWQGPIYAWAPEFMRRFRLPSIYYQGKASSFPDYLHIGGFTVSTKLPRPTSTLDLWQVVLITAIAAAIAEGVDVFGLDDNLTLPVLSGLLIWASLYFLG